MSTTLYWEPIKERKLKSLSDQLKYILAPIYWQHDGSLRGEEIYLRDNDVNYLCGIRDGTRDKEVKESCETLIEAIQKYGGIKIWLET